MASIRVVLLIGLTAIAANPAFSQMDRITGKSFVTRSEVIARNGMAATAQPLATEVAIDILKKGGSAVDAAIAANATLGLMEPVNCGIGGDLFAIVWDAKSQKLYGINGSGRSPKGLSYDQMKAELSKLGLKAIPKFGMLSISVPGAVDAWFVLHNRFGKLPIQDDLAPAIQYATEGFPVTEYIAYLWQRNLAILGQEPGGLLQTYTINGAAPKKGDVFKNPDLANTYRIIAGKGRDAFYNGSIADKIDAFFRANGGYLRKEDFSSHHSDWVDLVTTNYRGYDVYELPPNTQGGTVLEMLNILEGFDLKSMGFGKADGLHVMIEAKKLAFEDRAKMYADPAFYPPPLARLLSKDYATERRKLIDIKKAALRYDAGDAKLAQGDTTYLCVADKEGNMVSLIQSNFRGMGPW
ncbi:MAG: gamma-glutamyltransferase family protein, partial [Candidatus Eremiobacteraeota bacterium]|nr:gamma-glutamyltransferase family protein [Candidatus Eremiobacteraeota bacterium]